MTWERTNPVKLLKFVRLHETPYNPLTVHIKILSTNCRSLWKSLLSGIHINVIKNPKLFAVQFGRMTRPITAACCLCLNGTFIVCTIVDGKIMLRLQRKQAVLRQHLLVSRHHLWGHFLISSSLGLASHLSCL